MSNTRYYGKGMGRNDLNFKLAQKVKAMVTGPTYQTGCYGCNNFTSRDGDRKMYCAALKVEKVDPEEFRYVYFNTCKGLYANYDT